MVKLLLDAGACTQAKTEGGTQTSGCTPLQLAVYGQNGSPNPRALDISKLLIDGGAELEAMDSDGDTVLMSAVVPGDPAVVQLLIDEGAKLETKNKKGESALDIAR